MPPCGGAAHTQGLTDVASKLCPQGKLKIQIPEHRADGELARKRHPLNHAREQTQVDVCSCMVVCSSPAHRSRSQITTHPEVMPIMPDTPPWLEAGRPISHTYSHAQHEQARLQAERPFVSVLRESAHRSRQGHGGALTRRISTSKASLPPTACNCEAVSSSAESNKCLPTVLRLTRLKS
jgi:hypothetical protein